ncbi:MAG: 3'(2'),5'-bisphosphate nucleotidase CysQ [Saprospiraceae bacterium]|nr:3'(2'),5'-bisphosphate nucleotidase CysQ [Saprospiraceae bacterium]
MYKLKTFMEEDFSNIFNVLKIAGNAIIKIYHTGNEFFETKLKSDHSPVTLADITANNIICKSLVEMYPEIPVISEESDIIPYDQRKSWAYVWLLDPLDGTKEFINKTDEFSINLALIKNGIPVAGFVYLPVFESLYYAIKGKGAFETKNGTTIKLSSSSLTLDQHGLRVVASRNHMDTRTKAYIDVLNAPQIISMGGAMKFISIAKGEADYYPRMIHIMEWDTAAGQIIIEEAGGSLVDSVTGLPLRYNKESMLNPTFIATGKII